MESQGVEIFQDRCGILSRVGSTVVVLDRTTSAVELISGVVFFALIAESISIYFSSFSPRDLLMVRGVYRSLVLILFFWLLPFSRQGVLHMVRNGVVGLGFNVEIADLEEWD